MNLLVSMRYLVALDEHKHFARAAQACFITQPALSNALKALEEEFGSPIVKRSRTFVGFTPEGERLLESARRMLREEQLLKQDLKSVDGQIQGQLSIGFVPSAEPVAARFAALLQARHPGITPIVSSMSSQDIEERLHDLTLDLGLGFIERARPGVKGRSHDGAGALQMLPQYTEHYFLVRRVGTEQGLADKALTLGQPIAWQEAAELSLCLMSPDMYNRHIVDEAFAQVGVRVQPVLETNSVLSLALTALEGTVACIMPGALVRVLRKMDDRLEIRPLDGPQMQTSVGFMAARVERPSRTLEAALALAQDAQWLKSIAAHEV